MAETTPMGRCRDCKHRDDDAKETLEKTKGATGSGTIACRLWHEAIKNMPRTHERLKDNEEWNRKSWLFRSDITSEFAKWSVKLSPYPFPENLEKIVGYLDRCLIKEVGWKTAGMAELSLNDINKLLYAILWDLEPFMAWNRCKVGETPEITFTCRYNGTRDPDHDFIDLDALLHNVCIGLRDERRKNDAFKFGEA